MNLLDYTEAARKKLKGLLGDMPISQLARGDVKWPTVEGLKAGLLANKPFQVDDPVAQEAAMSMWNPAGLAAKIVYHGSPHKFDRFDASKIGTGEGAQAYGHGTYLADKPEVASEYALTNATKKFNVDVPPNSPNSPAYIDAIQYIQQNGIDAAKQKLSAMSMRAPQHAPYYAEIASAIDDLASKGVAVNKVGHLYKADLPDELIPKMLDWDKPIKTARLQGSSGEQIYKNLVAGFGDELKAVEYLKSLGIPGIKYLDGSSRSKGQGSYNYVVFPGVEDKIKILERNGLGLLGP